MNNRDYGFIARDSKECMGIKDVPLSRYEAPEGQECSNIQLCFNRLDMEVDNLKQMVDSLRDRLQPVLANVPVPCPSSKDFVEPSCGVSARVMEANSSITATCSVLSELLHRLQI